MYVIKTFLNWDFKAKLVNTFIQVLLIAKQLGVYIK